MKATIERAHAVFQEAFARFVEGERALRPAGVGELKLALAAGATRYERLYCVDFAANEGEWKLVEMSADSVDPSPRAKGSELGVEVDIEGLRWNDVVIEWPAPDVDEEAFAAWFERWFDPDDVRQDSSGAYGGVIHSLSVQPRSLTCDLGSAPPEALWELLECLDAAGVGAVRIRPSAG